MDANSDAKFYRFYVWEIYDEESPNDPVRVAVAYAPDVFSAREQVVKHFVGKNFSASRQEYMLEVWKDNPRTNWFFKFLLDGAYQEFYGEPVGFTYDMEKE